MGKSLFSALPSTTQNTSAVYPNWNFIAPRSLTSPGIFRSNGFYEEKVRMWEGERPRVKKPSLNNYCLLVGQLGPKFFLKQSHSNLVLLAKFFPKKALQLFKSKSGDFDARSDIGLSAKLLLRFPPPFVFPWPKAGGRGGGGEYQIK